MKNISIFLILATSLSCSNDMKNNSTRNGLSNEIGYKDKINNKVYFDGEAYKMILFALRKDQEMKPHSAKMDTPLIILEGQTKITIGDLEHVLSKGESIVLPKDIDHGVYPITDVKFILIK